MVDWDITIEDLGLFIGGVLVAGLFLTFFAAFEKLLAVWCGAVVLLLSILLSVKAKRWHWFWRGTGVGAFGAAALVIYLMRKGIFPDLP